LRDLPDTIRAAAHSVERGFSMLDWDDRRYALLLGLLAAAILMTHAVTGAADTSARRHAAVATDVA
jgi:hypothetical protein